jgi:hypothetical protein
MRIIGIHGYKASPEKNFWPWLKGEMRKAGHDVIIPQLPEPENPDPYVWIDTLIEEVGILHSDDIVIGHSLGAPTALQFLEAAEARSTPKGVILVSPAWHIEHEKFNGFFLNELDFEILMWKAKLFSVIHDKRDNVIPFNHAKKYARELQCKLIQTEGNGHFDGPEYPTLLAEIGRIAGEEIVYAPGATLEDDYQDL